MKLRVCFEIDGLAEDGHGNPAPAGLAMTLGETEKQIDYQEFTQNISIVNVLKSVCLDSIVKPEDVKIITPEEYDEKYGDDDEGTSHERQADSFQHGNGPRYSGWSQDSDAAGGEAAAGNDGKAAIRKGDANGYD